MLKKDLQMTNIINLDNTLIYKEKRNIKNKNNKMKYIK